MGDEEQTRVCGCCKKEVAEVNFALHESHCRRFLVLCPDCDENVPRSELEEHREEQHALVRCPKCQRKMEKRLLAEHEEEQCPARVEACTYCDLEMPWSELQAHTVVCGSRTERCADCGRYVKLSDRAEHDKTCSDQDLYNEEPGPTQQGAYGPVKTATRKIEVLCKTCMIMFPAEEIKKHEMRCTAAPRWNNEDSSSDDENVSEADFLRLRNLLQGQPQTNTPNGGASWHQTKDPQELGTCPFCQLLLPHITLRWHEGKCKLHKILKHREDAATNV
uniref:TRAF-type domain-containing protein n=1 Tax=Neogobius melanostomus TaxID=47308 RepID=A0A8C6UE95_9GOBI